MASIIKKTAAMSINIAITETTMQQWLQQNHTVEEVRISLLSNGLPDSLVDEYLVKYKKILGAKRQMNGFVCLTIGAFLGFISCVCTLANVIPSFYYEILYGLTSIAITIIFVGLYFVFED